MNLPKSFTTVTTFSKVLALALFFLLPILGFYLGMKYHKINSYPEESQLLSTPKFPPNKINSALTSTITPTRLLSTPTIKPPIILENWKTFKDEKYNISFKYPEFWYENPYKEYYSFFLSNYDLSKDKDPLHCWEMTCAELFYKIWPNTNIDTIQNEIIQKEDPLGFLRGDFNFDYINGNKIMYYYDGVYRIGSVQVFITSNKNVIEFSFEPDNINFPKTSWLWVAHKDMDIYKKIFESVHSI